MDNTPVYVQMTDEDVLILKNNLNVKYRRLLKVFFLTAFCLGGAYLGIVARNGHIGPGTVILAATVFYVIVFIPSWIGSIAKLRKDLSMRRKVTSEVLVLDKARYSNPEIHEHYLLLHTSDYSIRKIGVPSGVYEQVPISARVKITIAPHSYSFLKCEIL
ncbi:hypothetical protein [Chitinophaga flava]|uniref:Uncharacterized protein n=1 Tax=Chitinophaga flava TaxID=2259036 RepID=A0A365Y4Q5_9BACT|nr:hypothetical protein [Chitinophaga flava]RBL93572.1 hypothetical protein DF182_13760 [Chitinophaga flava]